MGIFDDIYKENTWLVGSGLGSLPGPTKGYRNFVQKFLRDHAITSVVDFGCGDWQFSKFINWDGVDYKGYDIVKPVIERNQKEYAKDNIHFFESPADWTKLPPADLLLVKDVLQHLSNEEVQKFLDIAKKKYKYMLVTNGTNPAERMNEAIQTGEYRPLDIRRAPFGVAAQKVYSFKGPKELNPKPWPLRSYWYKDVLLVVND